MDVGKYPGRQVMQATRRLAIDEVRSAELRQLAEAVNDTARMARNTLTAALVVALYLGVTLLSATDYNLFVNGQVVLPPVGSGISIVQSYVFAPPVFLFLHVQALLLLGVLARKVDTFRRVVEREPDPAKCAQYWDWLSGFAFVQAFSAQRGQFNAARLVSWFGICAIPFILLFLIDLSFVRFQSDWITAIHHLWFTLDACFICWFIRIVERANRPRFWLTWYLWQLLVVIFALWVLWWQAWAPRYHAESVVADRKRILRDDYGLVDHPKWWWVILSGTETTTVWKPPSRSPVNLLDDGPCELWRFGCRFLDVSNTTLVRREAEERYRFSPRSGEGDILRLLLREHAEPLNLRERVFRFAVMDEVFAPQIKLIRADLRGARIWKGDLSEADLRRANLQGANLSRSEFSGANLLGARLQNAKLECVLFQNANLERAQLQRAILKDAQLTDTILLNAQLEGADLEGAQFEGAQLQKAYVEGERRCMAKDAVKTGSPRLLD